MLRCRRTLFDACKEDWEAFVKVGARLFAEQVKEELTTVVAGVKTPPREADSHPRTQNSLTQSVQTRTQKCQAQIQNSQTQTPFVRFVLSAQGAGEEGDVGMAVCTDTINRGMICRERNRPSSVREGNKCENTHQRKIAVKHGSPLIRKPLRLVVLPKLQSVSSPTQGQQRHVDTMQTCQASPTLQLMAKENIARERDSDCSVIDANTLQTGNGCPMVKFKGMENIDDEHDEVDQVAVTTVSAYGDGSEKATGRKVDIPLSRASNPSTLLPETADWLDKSRPNYDGVPASSSKSSGESFWRR